MPTLEEGIEQNQFDNVIVEFLRDRSVADMTNAKEALTFEYSYWPQRQNRSWIRQELIDVSTSIPYQQTKSRTREKSLMSTYL